MSVNKVIILGRLGQDPELKHTPSGAAVCNFSLATSETWNDKSSGLCNQYLAKGRQAFVEGKLQTRSWDDKDGNKKYTTEINATTVQFIGGQAQAGSNNFAGNNSNNFGSAPQEEPSQEYNVTTDANFASDDIPF
jgi:single-strand DNA-binding protein